MASCILFLPISKILIQIRGNINVISEVHVGLLTQEAREYYIVRAV
jgi:hypothetical protein